MWADASYSTRREACDGYASYPFTTLAALTEPYQPNADDVATARADWEYVLTTYC